AAALMGLWLAPGYAAAVALMALAGTAQGWMFFCSGYYVSNDLRSSRNVGINEAMVGVGNLAGIVAAERVMNLTGRLWAFYPLIVATALALLGMQLIWLLRRRPTDPAHQALPAG